MKNQGLSTYFSDVWNMNDLSMSFIYIAYRIIFIIHPDLKGNYLVVNNFEYEDGHQEIEVIIDML